MRWVPALFGLLLGLTIATEAMAQVQRAKPGPYDGLSQADRRIVSALYEAQLGSRRDLAGHPLLSKDKIAAMRRGGSWEEVHRTLASRGLIVSASLADAVHAYERDTVPVARAPLVINTGTGEQLLISRSTTSSRPATTAKPANILPVPMTVRPRISVVELPAGSSEDAGKRLVEIKTFGGVVIPGATASMAAASSPQSP